MPIVGCYTLDLYCDREGDCVEEYPRSPQDQYNAESGGEARQQARRNGWRLNLKAGTAICPHCRAEGYK